jgi:hypothetical protein
MIVFKAVCTPRVVESLGWKSFDSSWASHQAQLQPTPKPFSPSLPDCSTAAHETSEGGGERQRE